MIRWEIEPRCNLKCKHCFVADTEYGCATTSLENGLSYLNKLHELGVRTVVFSTREPLLYDGLCRLQSCVYSLEIQTTLSACVLIFS